MLQATRGEITIQEIGTLNEAADCRYLILDVLNTHTIFHFTQIVMRAKAVDPPRKTFLPLPLLVL